MHTTRGSREGWLLAITALLVIGAGLGLRDPWPADEPRFALVAKQMVESGDWLFPHRGTELYSDKPPMLMWLQAGFHTLLRDWRVAFLLPSLLASLGTLWCTYDLGRRLWTRRVGLYAAWAVLFTVQFTWQAKKAQIDPLVVLFITLANYGLLRHLLLGPDWRMWALGWFAAGLGTITKGVGAIALLMLLPAAFASLRGWPGVSLHARGNAGRFWLGPLAFLAAVSIWLLPMATAALSHPEPVYRAYLDDILFRQTAGRYADAGVHAQPPWYFLQVMATMWLPALLALPWALPTWRRRLRRRDPRYLLPLAWWGLVLLFFTLSSGKRDMYILPALPMACLALAPLLPGILRRPAAQRIAWMFAAVLTLAALVAGLAMWFGDPSFEQRLIAERGLVDGARGVALWLLATGVWGLACLMWFARRNAVAALLAALSGVWILFGFVGAPLLNDSSSSRGLMLDVGQRIGPEAELGLVDWKEQQLLMADRPAVTFGFKAPLPLQWQRALQWALADPGRRWLLVQTGSLPACVAAADVQALRLTNRRQWGLLPARALAGCPTAQSTP